MRKNLAFNEISEGNVLNEKLFVLLMYEFISEKNVSDSLTNDKDEDS